MKLFYDIDSKASINVVNELNEATGVEQKKYKIKGIFSTIGEKNRNGRIYPKKIWESEVQKYQSVIETGSINTLMEWEHPPRTNVDMMESVQKITSLKIEGNYVMGEAVLLDNPKQNQIKSLIENGIKISVSSRGVGSVKEGIVDKFKLITYDLVSEPSDFNQTMNGLVESEGGSFMLSEGVLEDKTYELDESGNIVEAKQTEQIPQEEVPETEVIEKCKVEEEELKKKKKKDISTMPSKKNKKEEEEDSEEDSEEDEEQVEEQAETKVLEIEETQEISEEHKDAVRKEVLKKFQDLFKKL